MFDAKSTVPVTTPIIVELRGATWLSVRSVW